MPAEWTAICKDCGKNFNYSDFVHRQRLRRGLSAPERCQEHRKRHSEETAAMGSSHFGLNPKLRPNILGSRFLGSFDRSDRGKPRLLEIEPEPSGLDLGLRAEHVQEIYEALKEHRALIIVAPTGAGKSTVIPFRLISPLESSGLRHDHFTPHGKPIVVTQPRRVATSDIPEMIARKLYGTGVGPGSEIGYRHGKERGQTDLWNRLIFLTDGTLLNWLANHRAGEFSIVVIDEAHERSTTIDLILALMRKELVKHPHLRLIILSATIQAEKFLKYFEAILPGQVWTRDFVESEKTFGYVKHWPSGFDFTPEIAVEAVANKVIELLGTTHEGGILGFMPGEQEIKETLALIEQKLDRATLEKTLLLPLYSKLAPELIKRATGSIRSITVKGKLIVPRRVVIATNLAETSLTIPDVAYVIDSGLLKESRWHAATQTDDFQTRWHSQAGCRQRWGRAGRNRPGTVFPLYTEEQFSGFDPFTEPEIARTALDDAFIKATLAGVTEFESFEWLDQPDRAEIDRVKNAVSLRGLTDGDGDPTHLGSEVFEVYQRISRFLDEGAGSSTATLDMASLLLIADRHGCLIEAITFLVLLPHLGENLYHRQNGIFQFESAWTTNERDRVARTQESLRAGCIDDLDFTIKVAALFEGICLGDSSYGGAEWARLTGINIAVLEQAIRSRDDLLGKFVKNAKDRGIRRVDLALIDRTRLVVSEAWPDKKVTKGQNGAWKTVAGTQVKLSVRSIANDWPIGASGFISSFGKATQDAASSEKIMTGSVMVRLQDENRELGRDVPLAWRVHQQSSLCDVEALYHRLLADQFIPVGTQVTLSADQPSIFSSATALTYEIAPGPELGLGTSSLSLWQTREAVPIAMLDQYPSPGHHLDVPFGSRLPIQFVRRVAFPPSGEGSEYVCRRDLIEAFYVDVQDLSFSAWDPELDRYVGTERDMLYVGIKPNGRPVVSLLFDLEKGWNEIRCGDRCCARVTSVSSGDTGEVRIGIQIEDPHSTSIRHYSSIKIAKPPKLLAEIKEGAALYLSFRLERSDAWSLRTEGLNEPSSQTKAALERYGVKWENGQCRAVRRLTVSELYELILTEAGAEDIARRVFRMTHTFDFDFDSIDTDASLRVASKLSTSAAATWKKAWTGDKAAVREAVKAGQSAVKDAEISLLASKKVREILNCAWEIQELREKTEDRVKYAQEQSEGRRKFNAWRERQQAEVAKLSDWAVNNRDEGKRRQYGVYLEEARRKLAVADAERPVREARWARIDAEAQAIEIEASIAKKRLAELRKAGLPKFDLSGGRNASAIHNAPLQKVKKSVGSDTVPTPETKPKTTRDASHQAQEASAPVDISAAPAARQEMQRRIELSEAEARRLTAKPRGLLGALFGFRPQMSIVETVEAQFAVLIEFSGQTSITVRGASMEVLLAAEQKIRNLLT